MNTSQIICGEFSLPEKYQAKASVIGKMCRINEGGVLGDEAIPLSPSFDPLEIVCLVREDLSSRTYIRSVRTAALVMVRE